MINLSKCKLAKMNKSFIPYYLDCMKMINKFSIVSFSKKYLIQDKNFPKITNKLFLNLSNRFCFKTITFFNNKKFPLINATHSVQKKNFLKVQKANFSRQFSKSSKRQSFDSDSDLDQDTINNQNYDLTELSLKEEIKFLLEKQDYKKANLKIQILIDHLLSTKEVNESTITELESIITILSNNLRDMDQFENSILTQEQLKKKFESSIKDEELNDYMKIFLNDRIAFDYKMLENFEKTLEYLQENSKILENRINEDKLSIIKDRIALQSNLLNMVETMNVTNKENLEGINEILLKCLELEQKIQKNDKNEEIGFKLYSFLGSVNFQLDNLEEALEYYKESLKLKRTQGIEDDEDCFRISKGIAEISIELGDKSTALEYYEKCITIRENLIENKISATFDPDIEITTEDEKNHYIEIAKIYEALAEVYHGEGNLDITENLIKRAIESYHKHPIDDVYTGRCYMILAEIYLEKKEYEKCIEYSKRFLFAFNKFTKDKKKEIDGGSLDMLEYSRLEYPEYLNMEYKAYKYIGTSYFYLKEPFKSKKYAEMAIDRLITTREEETNNTNKELASNTNEATSGELNDFLNYKYELAQLYDLCANYAMTIKEYNEVIHKLQNIPIEEITVEEDSEEKFNKNIILMDAYVGKAEALFKLNKNSDSKKFLILALELIEKKNLTVDEEKVEEIRKKIELINLKLKHSANSLNNK